MAIRPAKSFLAFVADLLGPPPGRGGDRSSRSWWHCPAHDDRNPSFSVAPGDDRAHCFGCGFHPDAIDLVRHLNPLMDFAEARAVVEGGELPARLESRHPAPREPRKPAAPEGWAAFALALVADAEHALGSDTGGDARAYLAGRGLGRETILAARLGLIAADRRVEGIFADKPLWVPAGILVPWFDGDVVAMLNVRRFEGVPKYWAVRGSRRGRPYPSPSVVRAGRPLILVEGEFESLLLNQELEGLAPAVTFGSASDRPKGLGLAPILAASPWLVATDNDAAGEASAGAWLASSGRCIRIRPPGPFKDWTEARQGGVDLRRWWGERLAGVESPELFTWAELSHQSWGEEPGPCLDVGRDRPLRPLWPITETDSLESTG